MNESLKNSIVQFNHIINGDSVGTGFSVSKKHIITCTHVVKNALNLPSDKELEIGSCVPLNFPLNRDIDEIIGEIVLFINPSKSPNINEIEDITIIEVDEKIVQLPSPTIYLEGSRTYFDDKFCTFGFCREGGKWFNGVFSGYVGEGWIQLKIENLSHDNLNGLSGAPVWNKNTNMIYGMVVAKQNDDITAFMIPFNRIEEAWSEIRKFVNIGTDHHLIKIDTLQEKIKSIKKELLNTETNKIPIELVGEYNRLRSKLFEEEIKTQNSSSYDIQERAELCLISLESISRELIRKNFSETEFDEVNSWITTVEDSLYAYQKYQHDNDILLKKKEMSLLTVLRSSESLVRKNLSLIDFFSFHPVSNIIAFSYVSSPINFIDREDAIRNLLSNFDKYNMLVISGMGGMGKTYLGKKVVSCLPNMNIIWIDCNDNMSLDQLIHSIIGCIVKEYNGGDLIQLLEGGKKIDGEKLSAIASKIDKHNICLILDDFHKVSQEIEKAIEYLIKYSLHTKLLIITRLRSKFLRTIYFQAYTENLLGIDAHRIDDYLKEYQLNVSHDLSKKIYRRTGGNPLALRLFCSLCIVDRYEPKDILSKFSNELDSNFSLNLLNEIISDLDASEITFMEEFSVIKQPIDRHGIGKIVLNSEYSTILNSLIYRFLISEPFEREFVLHDYIRYFFYERLKTKEDLHYRAAKYYEKLSLSNDDLDSSIESIYHYFKSKNYDDAARIVKDRVAIRLYQEYRLEQLNKIINQLQDHLIDLDDELIVYKARIMEIWGDWDNALKLLEGLLTKGAMFVGNELFLASLNSVLHIYDQKGFYKDGLALFEQYKNQISEEKTTSELAHLYHRIGRFYHELGDLDQLTLFYDKSLSVSKAIKDDFNYIRTSRLKGVSAWFFGNYDESLKILEPLIDMCRANNNERELSDTLKHIGVVKMKKGLYEDAIAPLKESISLNEKLGYKHGVAWASMNLGDTYLYLNRLGKAESFLNRAMKVFKNLNEKNGILNTLYRLGKLKFLEGAFELALSIYQESLVGAKEINSPIWEGMVLEEIYKVYKKQGKENLANSALLKVEKIYKKIDSSRLQVIEKIKSKNS